MRVVGVIDLKGGRAVHASGGDRSRYQPVACAGDVRVDGDAVTLARFYRDVCGLADLYVADLDAIASGELKPDAIGDLAAVGGSVWLDAGARSVEDAQASLLTGARRVVVGLETLPAYDVLARICAGVSGHVSLSLDLRDGRLVCHEGSPIARDSIERVASTAWAAGVDTIVVLDLNRVGGHDGPAVREIARVRAAVPDADVYAGGGVGCIGDLLSLRATGVTGALVASALHDGRITPADLHALTRTR